jgi:NADH-quinone oxidoreductase subunit L
MAGPVSCFSINHAAMVTAGIFMITRLNYLFDLAPDVQKYYWSGYFSVAATIALVQTDIKKVLAYSTVSQLGLMFLALGLGIRSRRFNLHFLQGLLVLRFRICYSCFARRTRHAQKWWIKKVMTITFITLISSLAISGIPPFLDFLERRNITGSI